MVKVGPAFFESVSSQKISRRRNFSTFIPSEIIFLLPFFFLLLFFAIIIARLFYVQVLRGDYYRELSDQNRTRTEIIPAPRGIILDRAGRPLVANSPSFKIPDPSDPKKFREIGSDQALKMISEGKNVENDIQRNYLYKDAFAHVLGYVGPISEEETMQSAFSKYAISDFVGKMGLEKEYEGMLHGKNGKKLFEVDSKGQFMRQLGKDEPIPGQNLKTTLDLGIQKSVHDALASVERGAVVVSNPRDGSILAIYSKPAFDPNIFTHDKSYSAEGDYKNIENVLEDTDRKPLLDRAIGGTYPPGSTFKLVTATAALERGAIKPDTTIEDTGVLKLGSFSFGNWYFLQYGKTEGSLNVVGAIKRSNDIFFYKTGELTGVDNISSFAQNFGLGERLSIDLPGEAHGTVPTSSWKQKTVGEQWYLGDTYNYGIGQGYLLTTPLQVNAFTSVFANNGTLYEPHLKAEEKKVIKKDFIKKEYLDLVREGMKEACDTGGVAWPLFGFKVKNERLPIDNRDFVEDASGSARMVRVTLGCKTGTAETGDRDTKSHAWITVFAPFNNPEIAVTVLVENGGEGSSIAGPIAKKILEDYFTNK